MDYLDQVALTRHGSFAAFEDWRRENGLALVLITTRAERSYLDHRFRENRCCCSAARAPACRRRCTGRPMCACVSRCGQACARSTSPWPPPWWRRGAAADGGISAHDSFRRPERLKRWPSWTLPTSKPANPARAAGSRPCATISARRSSRSRTPCPPARLWPNGRPAASCARRGAAPTTPGAPGGGGVMAMMRGARVREGRRALLDRVTASSRPNSARKFPAPPTIRASGPPAFRSSPIRRTRTCRPCT